MLTRTYSPRHGSRSQLVNAVIMGGSSTEEEEARLLEEALRVLPEDVLELVKAKPPAERLQLLRALVQVCAARCELRCKRPEAALAHAPMHV